MKALTDKIKEKLQALVEKCEPNSQFQKGLITAINNIEYEESIANFEEVARVMMKHLGNPSKYNPHNIVIITNSTAELVSVRKGLYKIVDYLPD